MELVDHAVRGRLDQHDRPLDDLVGHPAAAAWAVRVAGALEIQHAVVIEREPGLHLPLRRLLQRRRLLLLPLLLLLALLLLLSLLGRRISLLFPLLVPLLFLLRLALLRELPALLRVPLLTLLHQSRRNSHWPLLIQIEGSGARAVPRELQGARIGAGR